MVDSKHFPDKIYIHLEKEDMKFSAGHFTIFSKTERESLHGHNYRIAVTLGMPKTADPLPHFDYRFYKNKLRQLCRQLNEVMILPSENPYLNVQEDGSKFLCSFDNEHFSFLARDVKLLNVSNVTVEQLSGWFIEQLTAETQELKKYMIDYIKVAVFSGPGQCGFQIWGQT